VLWLLIRYFVVLKLCHFIKQSATPADDVRKKTEKLSRKHMNEFHTKFLRNKVEVWVNFLGTKHNY
jgi:hypothetical protein